VDRATHADDTVHMRQQGLGHRLSETRVEHDNLDLRSRGGERLHKRLGRHHVGTTIGAIEHHAARLVPRGRNDGDDIAALVLIRGPGQPRAVSAEVHNRGLQLAQLAQQVEWLGRPSGYEVEPVAVSGALQFDVDRACLAVER
jgi:hypothetical protein